MDKVDVRDNLKKFIADRGIRQSAIAKKANLTPSKLSSILLKNRKLNVDEMLAICDAIRVKPEELIYPTPDTPDPEREEPICPKN